MITTVEPWFDSARYGGLPGAVLGILCALEGGLAGALAHKGKGKALVFAVHVGNLTFSAALLAAGIFAKVQGQPSAVCEELSYPGLIGLIVLGFGTAAMVRAYRRV